MHYIRTVSFDRLLRYVATLALVCEVYIIELNKLISYFTYTYAWYSTVYNYLFVIVHVSKCLTLCVDAFLNIKPERCPQCANSQSAFVVLSLHYARSQCISFALVPQVHHI